ncbi:MAG: hypothetical protein AVDCRST_MAG86-1497 [uncultured Truepera sp.]|uniref:Yip1 domain-containing protein n=1 Tax=uncultured Truepera sp. TaxID=543023 RepID=A0A6J4UKY7_9DEIN|nr:MAG: hypothetical protein AVDCRST_MAG86-1497 [uncultured Truepera sp.]
MRGLLTSLWTAASSPERFFRWLELRPTRTARGGLVAYGSLTMLGLACALGFAKATDSDAYLPLAAFSVTGSSALFLYAWAFGSVFVQRPGALEGRAWEVSGWSWTPALFGSVSMLVPLWVFPVPALALTLTGVLVWHLVVLQAGLKVFLERPAHRIVTFYALFIYALPLLLLAFVAWFSARFT